MEIFPILISHARYVSLFGDETSSTMLTKAKYFLLLVTFMASRAHNRLFWNFAARYDNNMLRLSSLPHKIF